MLNMFSYDFLSFVVDLLVSLSPQKHVVSQYRHHRCKGCWIRHRGCTNLLLSSLFNIFAIFRTMISQINWRTMYIALGEPGYDES